MRGRAEKLAVLALAKAVEAAEAPGFDDAALVESLRAVRTSLDAMANDLLWRIRARAMAGHEHEQYAVESTVVERLKALAGALEQTISGGLDALRTELKESLTAVAEGAAGVEHSHKEFDELSAAVSAVREALDTAVQGDAEGRQALEQAISELSVQMSGALTSLDDGLVDAELKSALRFQGLDERLSRLIAELPGKAEANHAHPDLSRALQQLSQRLAGLAEQKAEREHRHNDLEDLIAATRGALAKKADADHGEHLTAEAVQAMVRQAKPRDGKDGDSINPRPSWRPGQKAKKFDLVRHRNAAWLALRETSQVPSLSSPDWFLIAADGSGASFISGGSPTAPPGVQEPTRIDVEYVDASSTLVARKVVDGVETRYTHDANDCPQYAATAPEGTVISSPAWVVVRSAFDTASRPIRRDRLANVPADDPDSLPWPI